MGEFPFAADGAPERAMPRHVAIIMDGNGRWAKARSLPRAMGHRAGVEAVRRVVQAAGELGIPYLTLFSFSSENWQRPKEEVDALLDLMRRFIQRDLAELHKEGVKVRIIGEREDLSPDILGLIEKTETLTRDNTRQTLIVAFNYGSQDEISRAMRRIAKAVEAGTLSSGDITTDVVDGYLDTAGIPDPDLVIRTSGEKRLSNFLLWQAAYAELLFVDEFWPDFTAETFAGAIETYRRRERRFGRIAAEAGS